MRHPRKLESALVGLIVGVIAMAGSADRAHASTPSASPVDRAAEIVATLDVVASHCPQIRVDADLRERLLAASDRSEEALREDESYLQRVLRLNPLVENYDHETGCRMLSQSLDAEAPGLLSID